MRGEKLVHWEIGADFEKVPAGDSVDIIYEHLSPGLFLREGVGFIHAGIRCRGGNGRADAVAAAARGQRVSHLSVDSLPDGKARGRREREGRHRVSGRRLLRFWRLSCLSLKAGYTYEITWFYR